MRRKLIPKEVRDFNDLRDQLIDALQKKNTVQEEMIAAQDELIAQLTEEIQTFKETLRERITYLEYQLQAKKALIDAFESGDKYVQMQEEYRNNLRHLERRIKNLEAKLESAYRSNIKMRKNWMDVFEDLEKEMKKTEKIFQRHIKQLCRKLLKAEQERDEARDKIKEQRLEIYDLKTKLEEEQGKKQQLLAQINRDYENSSIPSSKKENRKKIANSREKTDKKEASGIMVEA